MSFLGDHRVHLAGPHVLPVFVSVDQDPGEHGVVGPGGINREADHSLQVFEDGCIREFRQGDQVRDVSILESGGVSVVA